MSNYEEEEDTTVAFCAGCSTTIPDQVAMRDVFLQQGSTGVCPYCGGPVIVTDLSEVDRLREARERGELI